MTDLRISGPMTMAEVAARLGLHYDTFRKTWRGLYHDTGFPAPVFGKRWDGAAVEAWISRRSQAGPDGPPKLTVHTTTLRASASARGALQRLRAAG